MIKLWLKYTKTTNTCTQQQSVDTFAQIHKTDKIKQPWTNSYGYTLWYYIYYLFRRLHKSNWKTEYGIGVCQSC